MSYLIDRGIEAGDMRQVAIFGGLLLLCSAAVCDGRGLGVSRLLRVGKIFRRSARGYVRAGADICFANIDKFSTSSIVTRLTMDITYVRNTYNMMIRMAVRSPMMMIFAVIMAFSIDREISAIFFWAADPG